MEKQIKKVPVCKQITEVVDKEYEVCVTTTKEVRAWDLVSDPWSRVDVLVCRCLSTALSRPADQLARATAGNPQGQDVQAREPPGGGRDRGACV